MPYFTDAEIAGLQDVLVQRLYEARKIAQVPFIITSGVRTPEHNAAVGGVSNSSHVRGLAVDLECTDPTSRYRMIVGLLQAGFTRLGIYQDGHIHADVDSTLPQNVVWLK